MTAARFRNPRVHGYVAAGLLFTTAASLAWLVLSMGLSLWGVETELLLDVERTVSGGSQLTYLITALAFWAWLWRMYSNLPALGATPEYSGGFAIGCWFIPVANLWLPMLVAFDLWRSSAGPEDEEASSRDVGSVLVGWWWAFFIGGRIANVVSGSTLLPNASIERILEVAMLANAINVAAALLGALFVLRVTRRQILTGSKSDPTVF